MGKNDFRVDTTSSEGTSYKNGNASAFPDFSVSFKT